MLPETRKLEASDGKQDDQKAMPDTQAAAANDSAKAVKEHKSDEKSKHRKRKWHNYCHTALQSDS